MSTERARPGDAPLAAVAGAGPVASPLAPSAAARGGLPLAWQLFLATALVVAGVLGGALWWTARSADRAAVVAAARGVTALRGEVNAYLDGDARGLADGAAVFARAPAFRSLIAAGHRADAADQSREAADRLRAAWVQVTDAAGVRLAKSDEPTAPAASLGGSPLVREALAGRTAVAFGTIGDTALVHVVAVPVEGASPGLVVGTLTVARPLDARAARERAAGGGEVAFFLLPRDGGVRLGAATLPPGPELLAVGRALLADAADGAVDDPGGAADDARPDRGAVRPVRPPTDVRLGGERFLALAEPLRSAAGRAVGGFAVLRGRDQELAAFAAVRRATLVAGAVGMVVALLVSSLVARRVTRPLATLAAAAQRAGAGDYATPIALRGGAEVGVLAAALRALLDDLRAKQVLVEFARLSSGRAAARRTPPHALAGVGRALGSGSTVPFARAAVVPAADAPERVAADAALDPALDAAGGDAHPAPHAPHAPRGDAPAAGDAATPLDALAAGAALRPGHLLGGRFRLEALIGAGGTGVVFRARDEQRRELVALKVLRPDVAEQDPAALPRLRREADTARQLAHPNIVRTFDLVAAEGLHFLTMEYVQGTTLRELIDAQGTLSLPVAVASVQQLCRALEHAHQQGVVHRDVKPHNAIVTAGGLLKVMDFGIARFADAPRGITETGIVIGTPAYMAPEVLRGGAYDGRADVYAAGAVLYECLVGRPPFEHEGSPLLLVSQVLEAAPVDPCRLVPELPRAVGDLILAALAKDPSRRPQSAAALADGLAGWG